MKEKLEEEQQKLEERIRVHDQLMSERARLENMIAQNQAGILTLQGRIQMLQELIEEDDNPICNDVIKDSQGNIIAAAK